MRHRSNVGDALEKLQLQLQLQMSLAGQWDTVNGEVMSAL